VTGGLDGGADAPRGAEGTAGTPEHRSSLRLAPAALAFSIAALLASWNPIAAPFGLIVGAVSLVLAARALARPVRQGVAWAALGIASAAVLASVVVLALTAGVGRDLRGSTIVPAPPASEIEKKLDTAADEDRAARERARKELEDQGPGDSTRGHGEGARRPARRESGR
jgi:hypothetical protein